VTLFTAKSYVFYRESWLIGQTKAFKGMLDISAVLEEWANEYGGVYLRPGPLGSGDLIVTDPKAVAHVFKNTEVSQIRIFPSTSFRLPSISSAHIPHTSTTKGNNG
jgi:hypothetical protein